MTFPRHFDCTYVNTQKYEFRTISGRSTISGRRAIGALKGRQLLFEPPGEQLAPRRGANFSLHFRGVSNPFVFYAPRGANYAEFGTIYGIKSAAKSAG